MTNSYYFNISMICSQKARFLSCLAIKIYMKANEITALPSSQARYWQINMFKRFQTFPMRDTEIKFKTVFKPKRYCFGRRPQMESALKQHDLLDVSQ